MPVDLQEEREQAARDQGMPSLTSEASLNGIDASSPSLEDKDPILRSIMQQADIDMEEIEDDVPDSLKELHPYAQNLTLSDVDSCVQLENATFSPETRGSREKFIYRFSKASELSLGLFTSATPDQAVEYNACTAATAKAIDSNEPERKAILLAHVIATKTVNDLVKDEDMEIPQSSEAVNKVGHIEHGRTIAIHSLAVLPEFQKRGIGSMLMKAYVQRMASSNNADRISLLAYDHLVPFYESLGFEKKGKGGSKHGGVEWVDMSIEFSDIRGESGDEDEE